MITLYKEINNKLISITDQDNIIKKIEENMWINLINPSKEDVLEICKITKLSKDKLLSTLDEEETAHLDVDDDETLIILDIPGIEDGVYQTVPIAIMYNSKYYITLCMRENNIFEAVKAKFKKIEPHKHVRLTLQIMYRMASAYISALKVLDSERNKIEELLHNSMRNKELLDLMDLNKSFVYFSTSLNSNKVVLSKLKRMDEYKKYEQDFDLIEDVEVENNQAIEMCSIYRDILAGMTDTFASIISNNLNVVMKVLAVITLIISIPTLIASLFGMNVHVPFADNPFGFYIIIGGSLTLSILGGIMLFVYTSKTKSNRTRKRRRNRNK